MPFPTETASLVAAMGGNGGDGDDVLVASGVALPAIFQTELRRWIMLLVFCIVNGVASGPMTMFPALEPILVQEAVFEGPDQALQLSTVYSISWALTMVVYLPLGAMYDHYGPKWMAVTGTWVFAVSSVGLGLAIRVQNLNWMMYFFYPVGVVFGYSRTMGGYGWHWLLPESQNTVNSLLVAIPVLADSLVAVCVWLHNAYGLSLWTYFWALSVLSVGTGILNSFIVPSQEEHLAYAAVVVAAKKSIESGYGGTGHGRDGHRDKKKNPIKTSGWRWWDKIKGTANTFVNYPVEHAFFVVGIICFYMTVFFYTTQIYPFYLKMFGAAETDHLLKLFALIYGCVGFLATILGGQFGDLFGLENMIILSVILAMFASVAVMVPTQGAQISCMVIISIVMGFWQTMFFRFCMVYGPVQLFGTYSGIVLAVMGLFQMGFSASVSELLRFHLVRCVQTATVAFGLVSATSFLGLFLYLRWRPPPLAGSVSCREAGIPEEEYEEVLEDA